MELEAAEGEAELEGDKLEYFSCAGECPGEEVGDEVGKDEGSWPLPPPPPPARARAAAAKRDCHGEEKGDKVTEVDETWGSWAPQVPPPPPARATAAATTRDMRRPVPPKPDRVRVFPESPDGFIRPGMLMRSEDGNGMVEVKLKDGPRMKVPRNRVQRQPEVVGAPMPSTPPELLSPKGEGPRSHQSWVEEQAPPLVHVLFVSFCKQCA